MNRDRMEGQWKQIKGNVRKNWGRWTGDEQSIERGERERHAGKMQKTYGARQDEARQQIRELQARY
jgi:uncharacterized protein YjbJ (UPF0337 family)